MPSRYLRVALLAVGLALVANPFLVFPHATDPSFEYRAMELSDDGYPFPVEDEIEDIGGLACGAHQRTGGVSSTR